jgi:hypothetical protein
MEKELGHTVSLRHIRGHLDYAINQLFLKMKSKADHFRSHQLDQQNPQAQVSAHWLAKVGPWTSAARPSDRN